ncbi:MAG: CpaD family pilus assembly lipoprotein [Bdellovibrionales bacterium]
MALPPACPRWSDNNVHFFDNQPLPQFGCADARNLAMMVEKPEDLLRGRDMGPASGVLTSGSIMRYNNNQTRGLIWFTPTPQNSVDATSAPTATSAMTGETPLNSGGSSSPLGK